MSCGTSTAAVYGIRQLGINSTFAIGKALGFGKVLNNIEKSGTFFKGAKSIGSVVYDAIKTGRMISQFPMVAMDIKIVASATKTVANAQKVGSLVNAIKLGMVAAGSEVPVLGNIVMWLISSVIFDVILVSFIDEFQYNHTISLTPLIYKGQPFVSGCKGYSTLIPGFKDSDNNVALDSSV
jgi:hypothetical protein